MDFFHLCSIQPAAVPSFATVPLALATLRAGGVALLDCDSIESASLAATLTNLRRILDSAPPGARLGVRLQSADLRLAGKVLEMLNGPLNWLVVTGWEDCSATLDLSSWAGLVWLEVNDPPEDSDPQIPFHGWLGRGSECGGEHGSSSVFTLAQHFARQQRPFLLQGGLGLQSALACEIAGAAGVVFDDQLLLMQESPLPRPWQDILSRSGGEDSVSISGNPGPAVRFLNRPETPRARQLLVEEDHQAISASVGWGAPETGVWPVGQGIGFARAYAEQYKTTGRFLRAVSEAVSGANVERVAESHALAPGNALAQSHGTEYPIVQGPMTRVGDRAAFAYEVARNGAMPMIALALLSRQESFQLLSETRTLLGSMPWGVGILGFVPPEIRSGQLEAVREIRPPYALIAGGRVDQSTQLEQIGIATYLHVPSPGILRIFLSQGARRFVFEGSECGGHTGPLPSLSLWQHAVDVLLSEVSNADAPSVHILFAGGIHDALSMAMASAMAAPLTAKGMRVGLLMGTAYLFTEEAVACGAIVPEFQQTALVTRSTVKLETGVGHYIRCAPTPFTNEFQQVRGQLRGGGLPAAEVSKALDALTIGRARAASKALLRDGHGKDLRAVTTVEQHEKGMYMMGEVAALRHSVTTMRELHRDVADGGGEVLSARATALMRAKTEESEPDPVAIIGAACFVPQATDPDTLWRNLLGGVQVITEIPERRFDWRLYFDPNPNTPDKIYSKWGGFLDELPFDPVRYGIPPKSLKSIATSQLLALEASRLAIEDAGYRDGGFDRENTAVIFGHSSTADLQHFYITRGTVPLAFPHSEPSMDRLPEWTEESFPGILMNVTAGRVANRLDLGGPNYTVDAACASSLAALSLGMRELQSGRSNLSLVAGVDVENSSFSYLSFSKTKALSKTGKPKPFDRNADGIVISEGVTALVLKRLADAERDGDRIYAVLKSVEGSSDGKGLGLTAPRSIGQQRALTRAYAKAGFSPATIGMYEAHGTGTAVGDRAELETIDSTLAAAGARPRSCAIGSAKSLLGHTKSAAGMVGTLKAALSLYHKTLPPHVGVDQPLDRLDAADVRLRLIDQPEPWLADATCPRRAGVSAFGFGGTNFHAVLEEYRGHLQEPPLGAAAWPTELFAFAAADDQDMVRQLDQWQDSLANCPHYSLGDLSFTSVQQACTGEPGPLRLAFTADSAPGLLQQLTAARNHITTGAKAAEGMVFSRDALTGANEIGFLFPGQGPQYPGMGRELAVYLPEFRNALDEASRYLPPLTYQAVRNGILPPACFDTTVREQQRRALSATDVAQPAIGTICAAMSDLAARLGIKAAAVAGHSYGEYAALHEAGVFTRETFFSVSAARGAAMAKAAEVAPGAMAAVHLSREELRGRLNGERSIAIANHNSPRQCVISGRRDAVDATIEILSAGGVRVTRLSVAAAFHSPLMSSASAGLRKAISAAPTASPRIPVFANYDGSPYPKDPLAIQSQLCEHLESPVEFVAQVLGMYRAGIRVFIELGPRNTLSALTGAILEGLPHRAVALDGHTGGLRGLLQAIASLFAAGITFDPMALFAGRQVRKVDLAAVRKPLPEWFVDGGRIRHQSEPVGKVGAQSLLNHETATAQPVSSPEPLTETLAAYQEYQETMRRFLSSQEEVMMQLLDRADGARTVPRPQARPAQVEAAPVPAPVETKPATEPVVISMESVTRLLTNIIATRTGYSADVFHPNQDLEADLGVDSIKRIEILSTLENYLPQELAQQFRTRMDEFMQVKTVHALASTIVTMAQAPTPPSIPRYKMNAIPTPLVDHRSIRAEGLFVITEDRLGVCEIACRMLERQGAHVVVLPLEALGSPERLGAIFESANRPPLQGILHLAPLSTEAAPTTLAAWRERTMAQSKSLFDVLRFFQQQLASPAGPTKIALTATLLGGHFGRDLEAAGNAWLGSSAGGGAHGMLRSLSEEMPHIQSKSADFDSTLSPEMIASLAVTELLAPGEAAAAEIGYPAGRRTVFRPQAHSIVEAARVRHWRPEAGWVVLATGASRGITAYLMTQMAAPGVRFIVVGSSPEASETDDDTSPQAAANLRKQCIEEEQRRGMTISPARIDREVEAILLDRERSRSLRELRKTGAIVEYHQVDVRNEAQFGALIEGVYARFGRIDAVVHGAGVIDDKLLQSKPRDAFDRVFDTKADSAYLLSRHLRPEGLRWIALFSSISSRFGNRGQIDYAAANEVLNRAAWEMARKWPLTRVACFNWGPWADGGMISEGVGRMLKERGFELVERSDGYRFFAAELAHGLRDDVEILVGAGPWSAEPQPTPEPLQAMEAASSEI